MKALADFGLSLPTFNNLIRLKIDAMPSCYALSKLNESVPRIEELVLRQVRYHNDQLFCHRIRISWDLLLVIFFLWTGGSR